MNFNEAYARFMAYHLERSEGERLRRLEGSLHAERMLLEKVWWPMFGHLDHLYPEFEVTDFTGTKRYLDYAHMTRYGKIDWEVHGFGPHWEKISRWKYADHLDRDSSLTIAGWKVISFSYDRVMEQPERCQQIIRQLLGSLAAQWDHGTALTAVQKDIVRKVSAADHNGVTPAIIGEHFGFCLKTSRRYLQDLMQKGWLAPAGTGSERIRAYRLGDRGVPLL